MLKNGQVLFLKLRNALGHKGPFNPNRMKTVTMYLVEGNRPDGMRQKPLNGMAPKSDLQSDAGALGWDGGLEVFLPGLEGGSG